eukprot:TRINITY_DN37720_c0_g1_i1.p1 TRINITY_DN37720_c0_g1~~TRINITY_DN37720_c0_g1_i1.p1  ORF type:complete len:535 (-),score=88.88 TRINITY_DN37720_c0_g1_i1:35-1444(-)
MRSVTAFLIALGAASAVAAAPQADAGAFVKLSEHSFSTTLTQANGLLDWLSSAATMPLRDRVQLMPPVPDRYGLFWNKKPIQTKEFEVRVNFTTKSSSNTPPQDGVVAMWLSPDNFAEIYKENAVVTNSNNWTRALIEQELTLVSNKATFKGLGIFFIIDGSNSRIASVWSSGETALTLADMRDGKAPGISITRKDWLDKRKPFEVIVKASSKGAVHCSIVMEGEEPVELLSVAEPKPAIGEQSFFGVSGYSGSSGVVEVDVNGVEVRNFDMTKVGDASAGSISDADTWTQVLAEEKKYISQESQMQAVQRLTKLLETHVHQYNAMGTQMKAQAVDLGKRLDDLGQRFGKLVAETEAFDFKKGAFDTDYLKHHLKGVHTLLKNDHDGSSSLHKVHQAAQTLKESTGGAAQEAGKVKLQQAARQAATLEEHAERGTLQTSFLLFLMVAAVACLGLLFLNRMRYYEKKHYV